MCANGHAVSEAGRYRNTQVLTCISQVLGKGGGAFYLIAKEGYRDMYVLNVAWLRHSRTNPHPSSFTVRS